MGVRPNPNPNPIILRRMMVVRARCEAEVHPRASKRASEGRFRADAGERRLDPPPTKRERRRAFPPGHRAFSRHPRRCRRVRGQRDVPPVISHPATRRLLAAARVETRRDHLASNDDAKRIFGVAHARDDAPRRVFLHLEEVRHEPRRPRAVARLFQRAKRGDVRQRRLSQFRVGSVGEAESSRGAESVERARVDSDAGRRDDHLGIVGDAGERRGERVREEGARTEGERHARFDVF